jgi:hypothetical protein
LSVWCTPGSRWPTLTSSARVALTSMARVAFEAPSPAGGDSRAGGTVAGGAVRGAGEWAPTAPGAETALTLRRRGPVLLRGTGDRAILNLSSMSWIRWIYGWIIRRRYPNIDLPRFDFAPSGRHVVLRLRKSTWKIYRHWRYVVRLGLVCAGSIVLVACSTALSEMPKQFGGLPEGTPSRPEAAPEYPAVHDMPPRRSTAVLTEEERKKVEAELAAMRAEQARRAKATGLPE